MSVLMNKLKGKIKSIIYLQPNDLKHSSEVALMDLINRIQKQPDFDYDYLIFGNDNTVQRVIFCMSEFIVLSRYIPIAPLYSDIYGMIRGISVKLDDSLADGILEIRGHDDMYTIMVGQDE